MILQQNFEQMHNLFQKWMFWAILLKYRQPVKAKNPEFLSSKSFTRIRNNIYKYRVFFLNIEQQIDMNIGNGTEKKLYCVAKIDFHLHIHLMKLYYEWQHHSLLRKKSHEVWNIFEGSLCQDFFEKQGTFPASTSQSFQKTWWNSNTERTRA